MDVETEERGYLDTLARDPESLPALIGLGALLYATGRRKAGRMALDEAVRRAPEHPLARIHAGNACVDAGELDAGRAHFEIALRVAGNLPLAHQGMAIALARSGDMHAARTHARIGFAGDPLRVAPYRGTGAPIRVLLIASALGGNIDTERILDDRIFERSVLLAEFYSRHMRLPDFDLVFNAVGDADRCVDALRGARAMVRAMQSDVVNDPRAVRHTARDRNARRLRSLPEVVAATTVALSRAELAGPNAAIALRERGLTFPLLLRAPGYHTGRYFERVETPMELAATLERVPGDRLLAISFIDVADANGDVRKYRAMIVDGALYPLHLAIARQWKVHYFSAEMERPAFRAEEEAFLEDMPRSIGERAMRALEAVSSMLGLDYGGIDFAFDATGALVVFEANATMNVFRPEAGASPSRTRAVDRIDGAVRAMLLRRQKASAMRAP